MRSGRVLLLLVMLHTAYPPGAVVLASSVRQVTVREMLAGSELVFEGEVVAVQAFSVPGRIYTDVTFEILERIQGVYHARRIVLTFLGGTVDGVRLQVADMRIPALGERGIYFVESLQRRQINPFFGWHQGHYLIARASDGRDAVMTADGFPVTQVDATPSSASLSDNAALGVRVSRQKSTPGMTPRQFAQRLTEIGRGLR